MEYDDKPQISEPRVEMYKSGGDAEIQNIIDIIREFIERKMIANGRLVSCLTSYSSLLGYTISIF